MELSQTSLAALFLYGVPLGVTLNILYIVLDIQKQGNRVLETFFYTIKDFLFMILAGLMTVLLVYYVNDGDFRYLALIGTAIGYTLSNLLLKSSVIAIQKCICHLIYIIFWLPIYKILQVLFGSVIQKTNNSILIKKNNLRIEYLMQLASNGFENNTEAKE